MVNRIISDFLGPFVVILQYTKTRTGLIAILFGAYLLTYALGILQIRAIKKKTHQLIEEKYREWQTSDPKLSAKKLFERFYPLWETELKQMRYLYIMNKHDLWPVKINPKNVLIKFPLSAEYIAEYLAGDENKLTEGINKKEL